jgi:hypothetical protein
MTSGESSPFYFLRESIGKMESDSSSNPYAPTSAAPISSVLLEQQATSAFLSRNFTYQNGLMCKLTCVLLGVCIFACVLSVLSSFMQLSLLQGPPFTDEQASANDLREQATVVFYFFVLLLTAIVFGTWINRAHHNVRGFGAEAMTITPGWAVGYFFVPILNLFRPYKAMSELWRASQSPENWVSNSTGLVPLWWTLWILNFILSRISQQVGKAATTVDGLIVATWWSIAVAVFAIPVAIVAMRMVMAIQKMQEDWSNGSGVATRIQ